MCCAKPPHVRGEPTCGGCERRTSGRYLQTAHLRTAGMGGTMSAKWGRFTFPMGVVRRFLRLTFHRGGYMKGRITEKLESVLQDRGARGQLRDSLIKGKDGAVSVGGHTYTVRIEVQSGIKSSHKAVKTVG